MKGSQGTVDVVKAVCACLLVLVAVVGWTMLKVDAYGGDVSCLVVRCVKVVR